MPQHDFFQSKKHIIELLIKESRHRQIVPFVGSGISVSAGFPTIGAVIQYLAKVAFAIEFGIYQERFPLLNDASEGGSGKDKLIEHYRQHPSNFIKDFGWPNLGRLDADLWAWLYNIQQHSAHNKKAALSLSSIGIAKLDIRDQLLALVQWVLRSEQARRDEGTARVIDEEWLNWQKWHYEQASADVKNPKLLYGDWEMLLDKLCEGDFSLTDQLFSELEMGLYPSQGHRLLAFLQPKLSIPLVLTTNFDSLLERAFQEEGLKPKLFDIHRDADLPDARLVKQQLSVVKLHGSSYGLRFGERLKQKLETDARTHALDYLPKNALILVLGFSGSERRMVQMLKAILDNKDNGNNPLIIWIQGPPGEPGPFFSELINNNQKQMQGCKVKHADTFLQELYFKIANSHQASVKSYLSFPADQLRMTELMLNPLEAKPTKKARQAVKIAKNNPLQLFVSTQETQHSGAWGTLAGTAFTQSLHASYKIIWIDLENHGTVESFVAEFFNRVKVIDPKSPGFNFAILDPTKNMLVDTLMEKVVDRICEVFQRGKYVMVLDSLESFGCQPMVHHGVPTLCDSDLLGKFQERLALFEAFFHVLFRKSPEAFKDSYIIMTADNSRQRWGNDNESEAYQALNKTVNTLKNTAKNEGVLIYQQEKSYNYSGFHETLPDDPMAALHPCWQKNSVNNSSVQRSLERAKHVYFLLKLLRVKSCQDSSIDLKGVVSAFVGLLAVFRRPRSVPLLRAMVYRWVLRQIQEVRLDEKDTGQTYVAIEHLLELISSNKGNNAKFREQHIGLPLLQINHCQDKDAVGIVAQRYEGGSLWMFREAQEISYKALTECLRVQYWRDNAQTASETISAVLDGMVAISWHVHAARCYYVDIYLPTHDIQAFYEYLYHRVSALRTITLLVAIMKGAENNLDMDGEVSKAFKALMDSSSLKPTFPFKNAIIWYADVIGVFSENPDYNSLDGCDASDANNYLLTQLEHLRSYTLDTLLMALKRNKTVFQAYSLPEIVLSWSWQFLDRELPEIKGERFAIRNTSEDDAYFLELEAYFQELAFNARLSRLDFEGIIQKYCLDIDMPDCFEEGGSIDDLLTKYTELLRQEKAEFNKQSLQCIRLLRCLIHLNPQAATRLAGTLLQLIVIQRKTDPLDYELKKLQRSVHAFKAKSILSHWSIWQPLRNYEPYPSPVEKKMLSWAETSAIAYEDSLRITCATKEEEAKHRAGAFLLRARSLYLQRHFRQAHRFLDLASSDLQLDCFDHLVKVAIINILRAELLATSADWHFRKSIKKLNSKKDQTDITIGKLTQEVHVALMKIGRAEQELKLASELFGNIAHQNIWLVFLEFGWAQLHLERMLFEMEELFLTTAFLDETDYLKHSGVLEQNILDGMGRLRNVLDLIPFRSESWSEIERKYNLFATVNEDDYPTLIKIERMCYALWHDFFVMGAFFDRLLDKLYKNDRSVQKTRLDQKNRPLNDEVASIVGKVLQDDRTSYLIRWKQWNYTMRFVKMGGAQLLYDFNSDSPQQSEPLHSLRQAVIKAMRYASQPVKINEIWRIRRNTATSNKPKPF